jgi:hypothetical protein
MVTFAPTWKGKWRDSRRAEKGKASGLQDFHLKRICLALPVGRSHAYVCGQARHERDPLLGSVLRLKLEDEASLGNSELLISESTWQGRIEPDTEHGCDYCFVPAAS